MQKSHVENFLRINDIPASAPDADVRTALDAAGWKTEDIDMALALLRGANPTEQDVTVITASQLLNTDTPITADALSALLGIEISIPEGRLPPLHFEEEMARQSFKNSLTVAVSMAAFLGMLLLLYTFRVEIMEATGLIEFF